MTAATAQLVRTTQDYHAFLSCSADHVVATAVDQLGTWLRGKKRWDVDLGTDGRHQETDRELLVLHHDSADGVSFRARLIERRDNTGSWTTQLTAHREFSGDAWITLDVTNDQGRFVDVPQVAGFLLQSVECRDGGIVYTSEPQVIHENRIDEALEIVCDLERRNIVFVAGTDEQLNFGPYVEQVRRWTRQVYGLAQVMVLDPAATRAFREAMFASHEAPPWTIRTFLPEVDPAVEVDGRRHRMLGSERLSRMEDGQVRLLLGRIARAQAATRVLPPSLLRAHRRLQRLENQLVLGGLKPAEKTKPPEPEQAAAQVFEAPPRPTEKSADRSISDAASAYLAQVELAKRILGLAELDEMTLRDLAERASQAPLDTAAFDRASATINTLQNRVEDLEDRLANTVKALEDEQLEHADTRELFEKLTAENTYLRSCLRDQGDYDAAFGAVPIEYATAYPETYEDFVSRVRDLAENGVVFTGNPGDALELADLDTLDKCLHNAWDAVLLLVDYVRARRLGDWNSGLVQFLKNPPDGYRRMPPGKVGATETGTTMRRFGDERMLPVPADVDPSGQIAMTTHFKLGKIGMASPRMYVYDDYARTGRVYIGYVGTHLTNTQTN